MSAQRGSGGPQGSPEAATSPQVSGARTAGRWRAAWLVLTALVLHVPHLAGPLRDGQGGNCAAMFTLMARNFDALGLTATAGVPLINLVPPAPGETLVPYTHHPPGLPWLVTLAGHLPIPRELGQRLLALLLTIASALLLADLAAAVAGPRAALAAGLLFLLLPAGVLHGLLVNYETVALTALLGLTRALLLQRRGAAAWAACAALADWVALLPLVLVPWVAPRRRALSAGLTGAAVATAALLHGRWLAAPTTGETLAQALAATFLGPDFSLRAWGEAWLRHGGTLFGLAGPLVLLGLAAAPAACRRALGWLLAAGLFNVGVFSHHATSHEHFWLLLWPGVALGLGWLAFPGDRRPAWMGAGLLAVLLGLGWSSAWGEPARRASTSASLAGAAFAAVSEPRAIHVTPDGASLVFLAAAGRQVWPYAVGDVAAARRAVAACASRFGRSPGPAVVFARADAGAPAWLAALGPGERRGAYRFWDLPSLP